jgi:excisionase family DNA binding protein
MEKIKQIKIAGRRLVNAATMAELFQIHKKTVLLWADEHELPVISVGNMRLFDLAEVSLWLDNHKKQPEGRKKKLTDFDELE